MVDVLGPWGTVDFTVGIQEILGPWGTVDFTVGIQEIPDSPSGLYIKDQAGQIQPLELIIKQGEQSQLTYEELVLEDSPVGYWRFSEMSGTDIADLSGNGHHGTRVGANLSASTGKSELGSACQLNGVDDYIIVPEAARPTGNQLSVEGWLIVANMPGSTSGDEELVIFYLTNNPWTHLSVRGSGIRFTVHTINGVINMDTAQGLLSEGVLYHVVGTYDGSTMRSFLNGTERASATQTGNLVFASGQNCRIGGSPGSTPPSQYSNIFDGVLDEIALYGHALSPQRIGQHYAKV